MNVLRTWRSLLLSSTLRAQSSSELFACYMMEMFRLQSLARTHTQIADLQRELHSLSPVQYKREISPRHSEQYSKNTPVTSDTVFQVMVTWNGGLSKASYCGTRYQLAEQGNLCL